MLCGGVASIVLIAAVCGVRPDISTEMKAPMFGSVCPCRRASNRRLDCDARPVVVDAARCALAPGWAERGACVRVMSVAFIASVHHGVLGGARSGTHTSQAGRRHRWSAGAALCPRLLSW